MTQTIIDENNSSLNEMLEQIRKIMSEDMSEKEKKQPEEIKKATEHKPASDVLELSTESIIEEPANDAKETKQDDSDVLKNIDNLLDVEKAEDTSVEDKVDHNLKDKSTEQSADTEKDQTDKNEKTSEDDDVKPEETEVKNIKEDKKDIKTSTTEIKEEKKEPEEKESEEKTDRASEDTSQEKAKESLVSEDRAKESSEALRGLIKAVGKPASDGLSFRNGTTMEDLVIELIKPKLSEWLDANLPGIVKHVVEKEVKKLIPREDD